MAEKRRRRRTALIVSDDPGLREGVAGWLEDDGLTVMVCPGPRPPEFSCVGLRGERCALLGIADLVLLDLRPEPDDVILGSRRSALVEHYRSHGKEMLALVDGADSLALAEVTGVAFLERHADRGHVLASVHQLIGSTPQRSSRTL